MKSKPEIELKALRINRTNSHETLCFSCSVYVDSKRFCTAMNSGTGGEHDFYPLKGGSNSDLHADITTLGKRINPKAQAKFSNVVDLNSVKIIKLNAGGELPGWWETSEHITQYEVFKEAFDEALLAADLAQQLKSLMRTSVLFVSGANILQIAKRAVADPHDAEKECVDFIRRKYGIHTPILNTMSTIDAFDMFRKYG